MPNHERENLSSERKRLREYLDSNTFSFPEVRRILNPKFDNPVDPNKICPFREEDDRKSVTADMKIINDFLRKYGRIPSFPEAGPRKKLVFDPESVKVAIATTGGLAPGLNSTVHNIVKRHWETYRISYAKGGCIYGIIDGFKGLYQNTLGSFPRLEPKETEKWLGKGGSVLGNVRTSYNINDLTERIVEKLRNKINILYIIGGDGSLYTAHEIAKKTDEMIVAGIPKTMDNDLQWIWYSFGFETAVQKATEVLNDMHVEAESTRRIGIVELFGAESGFVAANAALASDLPDLVLIPEEFKQLKNKEELDRVLKCYAKFLQDRITTRPQKENKPHILIVIAEGVAKILKDKGITEDFLQEFKEYLENALNMKAFINQPSYIIRSAPPSAQDHIHCKHLGSYAVDSALAGYTDFMVSQWLNEYVLVPLELVAGKKKYVPLRGIVWTQVLSMTGQPLIEQILQRECAELVTA
jgi:6-phosphofructokinase 1